MDLRACAMLLALVSCLVAVAAEPKVIALENESGFKVELLTTGATIQKLWVPGCGANKGKSIDVALGYDDISGYEKDPHPSFGATVGRVGNRISNAAFSIDGKSYKLDVNDPPNSIHGGLIRFSKQQWAAVKSDDGLSVTFSYTSKDGEGGFPGELKAVTTYSIPKVGSWLNITMTATTDKATPVNIINHNYVNLKGVSTASTVLDHIVHIPSEYYTPAPQGQLVPSGRIFKVKGTPYDFTTPTPISKNYLKANGGPHKGFDLNYVMPRPSTASQEPVWWMPRINPQVAPDAPTVPLTLGATVVEPSTGLTMRVYANAPGIHLYTGNYLDGTLNQQAVPGKGGVLYPQYGGFCFETQAFPNAINTPTFPSSIVRPGQTFNNRVAFNFGCKSQ